MRIALVSLDQIWQEKKANFDRCLSIMADAKSHGCELVIFPEMTLTGYSLSMAEVSEEEDHSLTLNLFRDAAAFIGLASIFGACLCDPVTKKSRNMFCLARPDSEILIIYSKIHPFTFAGEDKVLEAGNCLGMARVGDLDFGAAICYDLRFPELYSAMARQCNAIITIANWPERRINHWRSLLVARAIENQCFMFGVNRIGIDGNGLKYQKSSIAVTPDGELIEPVIPGHELDIYEIESADTSTYRNSFPTLRDKRYELYSELLKRY
jgi:predicted amidohydrolase